MSTVLQTWVQVLPWKMQSVLIAGSRGPDSIAGSELKKFTRWIRKETQHNADPEHTYMKTPDTPYIDQEKLFQEIEYGVTWHYFGHLLHALQIIGYCGLEEGVRTPRSKFAHYWYMTLVNFMHLKVEPWELMNERLRDRVGHT